MAFVILDALKYSSDYSAFSLRFFLPGLRITSMLTVVLLVCLETVLLCTVSNCAKSFYVHWNTTNSIFRIDNTDHIIDVNKGNVQFEYDQVNIICPTYMPGAYDGETEKYIIYNVSKEEYETCRITNPNPRIIAICDKPFRTMYFTITFRPFTPQPGGLEFLPGNDYYFISTSSKDDLHRRIGGRCSSHNMKIVFKVCCAKTNQLDRSSTAVAITRPPQIDMMTTRITWPIWHTPGPTLPTQTYPINTSPKSTQTRPSRKQINKKTNEYDKHPNEVVKNEELTYNGAANINTISINWLLIINCLLIVVHRIFEHHLLLR